MGTHLTIGYLQSKMIRMPLNLNLGWNSGINNCDTIQEVIDYIESKGTMDEGWRVLHTIKTINDINLSA
tara:strand:+ start:476 stop:682 length:207 start_codon:yes stop_codon:yes gene_type:complete